LLLFISSLIKITIEGIKLLVIQKNGFLVIRKLGKKKEKRSAIFITARRIRMGLEIYS